MSYQIAKLGFGGRFVSLWMADYVHLCCCTCHLYMCMYVRVCTRVLLCMYIYIERLIKLMCIQVHVHVNVHVHVQCTVYVYILACFVCNVYMYMYTYVCMRVCVSLSPIIHTLFYKSPGVTSISCCVYVHVRYMSTLLCVSIHMYIYIIWFFWGGGGGHCVGNRGNGLVLSFVGGSL